MLQNLTKNRLKPIAIAYNRRYWMLFRNNFTLFAPAPVLAPIVPSMRQHKFCVFGFRYVISENDRQSQVLFLVSMSV
jgi:hypothetical protein